MPAGMEILFEKVEGQHGAGVFGGLIDYVDKQVSKLVLGQTMTSDNGSSKAQATVHNDVRLDIQAADGKQLGQTITRDLVVPFVAMNFGPQQLYPRATYQVAAPEDLGGLTNAVSVLVPLGLKVSQREMRERVGLSEPEKDEELLGVPTATAPGSKPDDKSAKGPKPSETEKVDPAGPPASLAARAVRSGDAIDRAVDEILGDWEPLVAPMIAGLEAKLSAASDEAEARAILTAHLAAMDRSDLAEKLTQAVFAARLAGETGELLTDEA
ncbi:hypothetical protein ATO4_26447 [Aurantimonas sp. 22II-16-19i]|nr:hypothetical protein ATO4_26447 [Aurantimonas sp. 22II-16-19i]